MSESTTTWVLGVEGLPRTLSDHSPVKLTLCIPHSVSQQFTWRFCSEALLDPFTHTIWEAITQYFAQNKGSVGSAAILWEAFKATIQGTCMKDIRGQLTKIENTLSRLERQYESSPSTSLLAQIKESLIDYNELADEEIRYRSRRHVARAYGEGGRPGHNLPIKIKTREDRHTITKISDNSGVDHYTTRDIVMQFRTTYADMYTSQTKTSTAEMDDYFSDIALAWLSDGQQDYLSLPITEEDIRQANTTLPNKKAPGPDGLTCEFYKEYAEELSPYLLEVYAEAHEVGTLPPTLREALIITLLKKDKPPSRCDSYRPLSLININAKILAKMFATSLKPLMPNLVLPDQSGFIPEISTSHNLCTLFAM